MISFAKVIIENNKDEDESCRIPLFLVMCQIYRFHNPSIRSPGSEQTVGLGLSDCAKVIVDRDCIIYIV